MSKNPTPLARLLFEHGLDLADLKKPTKICYPTLLNVCHGFKTKTVIKMEDGNPVLDGEQNPIKEKIKIEYNPEDRTLRDIAEFFGVSAEEVYEKRHDSQDAIPAEVKQ